MEDFNLNYGGPPGGPPSSPPSTPPVSPGPPGTPDPNKLMNAILLLLNAIRKQQTGLNQSLWEISQNTRVQNVI